MLVLENGMSFSAQGEYVEIEIPHQEKNTSLNFKLNMNGEIPLLLLALSNSICEPLCFERTEENKKLNVLSRQHSVFYLSIITDKENTGYLLTIKQKNKCRGYLYKAYNHYLSDKH